jgi:hypothetical protein
MIKNIYNKLLPIAKDNNLFNLQFAFQINNEVIFYANHKTKKFIYGCPKIKYNIDTKKHEIVFPNEVQSI